MNSTALTVLGMTCDGCRASVERVLRATPGVESVDVDLASGRALVRGEHLDLRALQEAVERAGFELSPR